MVEQGSTVLDQVEDEALDGNVPQRRRLVQVSDDLAPEEPQVVHVSTQCPRGEIPLHQMFEERVKVGDDSSTWKQIVRHAHPAMRPTGEIWAVGVPLALAGASRLASRRSLGVPRHRSQGRAEHSSSQEVQP